ncbi:MAG TPA: hypothetical protein VMH04_10010 [Candidatus Solibacter sp.]|nr:hypothetical protein [Candidatus Solibacter sp.]
MRGRKSRQRPSQRAPSFLTKQKTSDTIVILSGGEAGARDLTSDNSFGVVVESLASAAAV